MASNDIDDVDIYEDLPNFNLEETIQKLETENKALTQKVHQLSARVEELEATNKELSKQKKNLSVNISVLYKTAKLELDRKNSVIQELNREREDILFRRFGRHKPDDRQFTSGLNRYPPDRNGQLAGSSRERDETFENSNGINQENNPIVLERKGSVSSSREIRHHEETLPAEFRIRSRSDSREKVYKPSVSDTLSNGSKKTGQKEESSTSESRFTSSNRRDRSPQKEEPLSLDLRGTSSNRSQKESSVSKLRGALLSQIKTSPQKEPSTLDSEQSSTSEFRGTSSTRREKSSQKEECSTSDSRVRDESSTSELRGTSSIRSEKSSQKEECSTSDSRVRDESSTSEFTDTSSTRREKSSQKEECSTSDSRVRDESSTSELRGTSSIRREKSSQKEECSTSDSRVTDESLTSELRGASSIRRDKSYETRKSSTLDSRGSEDSSTLALNGTSLNRKEKSGHNEEPSTLKSRNTSSNRREKSGKKEESSTSDSRVREDSTTLKSREEKKNAPKEELLTVELRGTLASRREKSGQKKESSTSVSRSSSSGRREKNEEPSMLGSKGASTNRRETSRSHRKERSSTLESKDRSSSPKDKSGQKEERSTLDSGSKRSSNSKESGRQEEKVLESKTSVSSRPAVKSSPEAELRRNRERSSKRQKTSKQVGTISSKENEPQSKTQALHSDSKIPTPPKPEPSKDSQVPSGAMTKTPPFSLNVKSTIPQNSTKDKASLDQRLAETSLKKTSNESKTASQPCKEVTTINATNLGKSDPVRKLDDILKADDSSPRLLEKKQADDSLTEPQQKTQTEKQTSDASRDVLAGDHSQTNLPSPTKKTRRKSGNSRLYVKTRSSPRLSAKLQVPIKQTESDASANMSLLQVLQLEEKRPRITPQMNEVVSAPGQERSAPLPTSVPEIQPLSKAPLPFASLSNNISDVPVDRVASFLSESPPIVSELSSSRYQSPPSFSKPVEKPDSIARSPDRKDRTGNSEESEITSPAAGFNLLALAIEKRQSLLDEISRAAAFSDSFTLLSPVTDEKEVQPKEGSTLSRAANDRLDRLLMSPSTATDSVETSLAALFVSPSRSDNPISAKSDVVEVQREEILIASSAVRSETKDEAALESVFQTLSPVRTSASSSGATDGKEEDVLMDVTTSEDPQTESVAKIREEETYRAPASVNDPLTTDSVVKSVEKDLALGSNIPTTITHRVEKNVALAEVSNIPTIVTHSVEKDVAHGEEYNIPTNITHPAEKDMAHGEVSNIPTSTTHPAEKDVAYGEVSNIPTSTTHPAEKDVAYGEVSNIPTNITHPTEKDMACGEVSNIPTSTTHPAEKDVTHGKVTNIPTNIAHPIEKDMTHGKESNIPSSINDRPALKSTTVTNNVVELDTKAPKNQTEKSLSDRVNNDFSLQWDFKVRRRTRVEVKVFVKPPSANTSPATTVNIDNKKPVNGVSHRSRSRSRSRTSPRHHRENQPPGRAPHSHRHHDHQKDRRSPPRNRSPQYHRSPPCRRSRRDERRPHGFDFSRRSRSCSPFVKHRRNHRKDDRSSDERQTRPIRLPISRREREIALFGESPGPSPVKKRLEPPTRGRPEAERQVVMTISRRRKDKINFEDSLEDKRPTPTLPAKPVNSVAASRFVKTPLDFRERYAEVFSNTGESSDDATEGVFSDSDSPEARDSDDSYRPKGRKRKTVRALTKGGTKRHRTDAWK